MTSTENKEQLPVTSTQTNVNKRLLYDCDFAVMCFCSMPDIFLQCSYAIPAPTTDEQPFTYVNTKHITYCFVQDFVFIVLAEIYGPDIGAATVEDLHSYGITKIYSFGFASALNEKLQIGVNMYAESAICDEHVSKRYMDIKENEPIVPKEKNPSNFRSCRVWTMGALYRQRRELINKATRHHCSAVNMDTSSFYSACNKLNIMGYYFCTISDIYSAEELMHDPYDNSANTNLILDSQNTLINNIVIVSEMSDDISLYKDRMMRLLDETKLCKSHDIDHFDGVYYNAKLALLEEGHVKPYFKKAILLAALLHDIDDKKLFPLNTNNQNARIILYGFSNKFIELVLEMINLASFSENGNSTVEDERKLLPRHCVRLEALGKTGIQRCYDYTKTLCRPIIMPTTPRVTTMNELTKLVKKYEGPDDCFITHFYCKLLCLDMRHTKNKFLLTSFKHESKITFEFILAFFNRKSKSEDEFITHYLKTKK